MCTINTELYGTHSSHKSIDSHIRSIWRPDCVVDLTSCLGSTTISRGSLHCQKRKRNVYLENTTEISLDRLRENIWWRPFKDEFSASWRYCRYFPRFSHDKHQRGLWESSPCYPELKKLLFLSRVLLSGEFLSGHFLMMFLLVWDETTNISNTHACEL